MIGNGNSQNFLDTCQYFDILNMIPFPLEFIFPLALLIFSSKANVTLFILNLHELHLYYFHILTNTNISFINNISFLTSSQINCDYY